MKKLIVLLLSFTLLFGLAACGGADENKGADVETTTETPSAEVVDVGEFTVEVPGEYYILHETDPFAEEDENGNYPIRTDAIGLIRGGESEWDAFSKPTIYINLYGADETGADVTKVFYEDVKDVECSINGIACDAFTGTSVGLNEGEEYLYYVIFYPISDAKVINISFPLSINGEEAMHLEDPDVQTILTSIKLK